MTFRSRILLACLAVALTPLVVFVSGARREVRNRLTSQYERSVSASRDVFQQDLARQRISLDARLRALAELIDGDAQQRAALLGRAERGVILNYAANVMPAAGLDYLLMLDSTGDVLSSGHFRNEYDRRMAALPKLLAADGPVLVATRRPQGPFLVLVRARTFQIGDQRFALAGGIEIDSTFLRGLTRADSTVVVALEYPGGALRSTLPVEGARGREGPGREGRNDDLSAITTRVVLPFVDDVSGSADSAQANWIIAHSLAPLRRVQRAMDRWFLVGIGAAVLLAFLIARALSARVTQPLEELAAQAERVNLERLDVGFATDRQDEIGSLARLLDTMVKRLRASANQLRDAERRATVGEMARQVNHDIRNGLLPIRNVILHLTEVARETPAELGSVFAEREETLQGGIGYLESLATNYARLSPRSERRVCDVNAIVRTVLRDAAAAGHARVQLDLSETTPRVAADPVALRRTIENLTINALESLQNGNGTVTVQTKVEKTGSERRVTIAIADTGSGIEPANLDRIFDDFYTTKERGTGLGLSIVRRLVADMGGRIRVESERGRGTTFRIELPEAS